MTRRDFVRVGGLSLAGAAAMPAPTNRRLPITDVHYRRVKSYIEEQPLPGYHWASEAAYEAFRDIKYGVRIHWGLYSLGERSGESWPFLVMPPEEKQRYQELYRTWNPAGFDASEWMDLFAESGLKMFAFTTKHHEGFSMFDTRTRVRRRVNWTAPGGWRIEPCDLAYSIMETPFRRDVVKELCEAARHRGIKIDLYFSHPDWYDADFRPYNFHPLQVPSSPKLLTEWETETIPRLGSHMVMAPDPTPEETGRMMARHRAQLTELLTNYGPIDMMCLDQWLGPAVWPQLRETVMHMRKLQPDVMLRARGIGNYGDYYTPEGFVPGSPENTDMPWFVIHALGSSFSYDPVPENYKGAGWIIRNLVDSVAKGGNFMVGIGPNGNGRFHPAAVAQLREAGEWLKINGEGIYATRPREGELWSEGEHVRFTRTKDGRRVYAYALQWPGKQMVLGTVRARPESEVCMLGYPEALNWRHDPQRGTVIELPAMLQDEGRRPGRFAFGFRMETA
jgi:alpha-L-fucosidase